MPVIGKDLIIPFLVGKGEEEKAKVKEAIFDFGLPGEETIEETWFIRNYDLYDTNGTTEEKALIKDQRHVDIRTFATGSGEKWTTGVMGPVEVMHGLPGLTLSLKTGTTETSSVVSNVNLRDEFQPTDFIIMALPQFPLGNVTLGASFIDFTSHPEGNFTEGPTASVSFLAGEIHEEENCEFRIMRSEIEKHELDIANITGIRLRIKVTGEVTVIFAGLRLVSQNWTYSPIDFDNWNGRWAPPVPPNGSLSAPKGYSSQPILWRATDPPSDADPRFIDSSFGIVFNTGSQTEENSFSIYLREVSEAFLSQIDLDGKSMAELDRRPQPDLGISEFSERTVGSLDDIPLSELEGQEVGKLERIEDPTYQGWISFTVKWGNTTGITITNSAEKGYTFNHSAFANNSYYIVLINLEGTTARLTIHALNPNFSINPVPFFDTTLIKDGGLFKRLKGRVGWRANLEDKEAFLGPIHPRGLTFAEYISSPFKSLTPVQGATLNANFSENEEKFIGFQTLPSDASLTSLTRDSGRSLSGSSWKVTTNGEPGQGIQTNLFTINDLNQAGFSFSIWYPSSLPPLNAKLVNAQGAVVPITLPFLYREQWQQIKINLIENLSPTGELILVFEQEEEGHGSFWLDNISIFQRAVQWSARAIASDPWEDNEAPWTDFRENINGKGTVMFSTLGTELQLRAKARQQKAIIAGPPQIRPKYAQLGRLVWPEEVISPTGPTAHFESSKTSPEVTTELIKFPEKPDESRGDLAITSSYVFWTDTIGGEESEGSIRRGPIAGGAATTPVKSTKAIPFEPTSIATDTEFIYFTHEKYVARAKLDGSSLEPTWLTTSGLNFLKGVAVDNTYVYWTNGGHKAIGRAKKANTSEGTETFITEVNKPSDIAVNSSGLYWISNKNVIETSNLGGVRRVVFYSRPGIIHGVFASSLGVMWTFSNEGHSGVGKANSEGGSLVPEFITGETEVGGLAANSEHIYWVNGEAVSRGALGISPLQATFTSTATAGSSPIVKWEWNFGDGSVGLGTLITHIYAKKGTYPVTLTVVDSFGLRSSEVKSVTVG